jgi:hypothetical protein
MNNHLYLLVFKMNAMKKLVTLIVIATLFIGCRKIKTPNAESEKIFGTWRFVNSGGGFSGAGNSSYDAADTYEYKENGTFSHYKGGQLINQSSFSLQLGASIYSQTQQLMVHYGSGAAQQLSQSFHIHHDTLVLNDEVFDGFQYVFVKE